MKKLILIICVLVLNFSCGNKKNVTTTIKQNTPLTTETPSIATLNANGDLIGVAAKSDFLKAPFNDWFLFNSENYELNSETIEALKPLLKDITIKAFMGTWCGDSQEQTPVFYKILDATNFNYKNLKLVALDRSKKTPDNLQEGLDIVRVPTFIFYRKGKEIGRFVEYPRESVEEDMFKIVSGAGYKHSYQD